MKGSHGTRRLPIGLFLLAVGCGSEASSPADQLGRATARIVGGEPDTTHPAVVYIGFRADFGYGSCSGTMVQADPVSHIGYVLTAAHCFAGLSPDTVIQGDDVGGPAVYYDALGGKADSRFPEAGHDLALVRVVGVDETTPVIPLVDPAAAPPAVGDEILALGYGTTAPTDQLDPNTARKHLTMSVVRSEDTQIHVTAIGDVCSGDSGGPMLMGTGAVERVAAVNSSADPACFLGATGTRVWPGFASELAGYMAEAVPESCERCTSTATYGHGACVEVTARCDADAACLSARECVRRCDRGQDCQDTCLAQDSEGVRLLLSRFHCFCDPCADLCAGTPGVCGELADLEARRAAALSASQVDGGGANALVGTPSRAPGGGGCRVSSNGRFGGGAPRRGSGLFGLALFGLVGTRRRGLGRRATRP